MHGRQDHAASNGQRVQGFSSPLSRPVEFRERLVQRVDPVLPVTRMRWVDALTQQVGAGHFVGAKCRSAARNQGDDCAPRGRAA